VEGLGRSFSGPGARLGSFTPFLDELAGRSLYWEHFLATQGRTFAVLPSVLGSLPFAPYGERPIAHDNLLSLLKAQGYKLRYFSGTDLAFDHQGAFLADSGVETFWSQKDFAPPARKISEWGYPDGDLMDAVLAHPVPAQTPSVTVVQTMSMHTPFLVPDMALYRQKVRARLQALGVPPQQHPAYLQQQDIYASVLYTDEVLRRFFSRMQSQPQWSNTVFVITGDHRLPEIEMASRLERYHVPLLVYSPMLRGPMRIKSVSSHFDIAPSVLALLSHRYGMPTPERVHWMGAGLDVHPQWRNLHALPLKQTKTELSDYVSGEYYLAQDQLMSLQDGLVTAPEDNPVLAQSLRQEFAAVRARLAGLQEAQSLVRPSDKPAQVVYTESGRSLQSAHRVQQIQGVVVSQTQAQLQADGQVNARGLFSLQGEQASPVFVPLLVLTDAQGRELAEVSGPAMTLKAGQSQEVALSLRAQALPSNGSEAPVFVALIVSHPETGRPIGKGQYHVEVRR
jgi:Sulfatase